MGQADVIILEVFGFLVLTAGGVVTGLMTPPMGFTWRYITLMLVMIDVAIVYMSLIAALVRRAINVS